MPQMILTASGRLGTLLAGYHLGLQLKKELRNVLWVLECDVPLGIKAQELLTVLYDVRISIRSNGQTLPDDGHPYVLVANDIPRDAFFRTVVIECAAEHLPMFERWALIKGAEQIVIIVREGEMIDPEFLDTLKCPRTTVMPLEDYLRQTAPRIKTH